jgi:hypothetical protein
MTESGPIGLDPDLVDDHFSVGKSYVAMATFPALNGQFIEFSEKKWFSRPLL